MIWLVTLIFGVLIGRQWSSGKGAASSANGAPASGGLAAEGATSGPASAISDELMSRLESSFRDVYLQLLSIIQGVAFGDLAAVGLAKMDQLKSAQWVALVICLMTIMTIWQEYVVGATAFAWIPTLLDVIIPFGLGLAEFALIAFAVRSTQGFMIALMITWMAGIVAQGNFWFHSRRGFVINRSSHRLLPGYVGSGFLATVLGAICLIVLLSLRLTFRLPETAFAAICLVTALPMFFRSVVQWSRPLKRERRRVTTEPSSP